MENGISKFVGDPEMSSDIDRNNSKFVSNS